MDFEGFEIGVGHVVEGFGFDFHGDGVGGGGCGGGRGDHCVC